jgi:hypothetical protein
MPGPLPKYPIPLTPEHEARLPHLSTCSTAPCAEGQRARLLLLAHPHPDWRHADMARQVGWTPETVRPWRRRGPTTAGWHDAPRAGPRRPVTPLQRAQSTARAGSAPRDHGPAWKRWAGEPRAPVASAPQLVRSIAPGTSRTWRRPDQSQPWRYPSWPPSTAPQCGAKATPVLALDEPAQALAVQGAAGVCRDEQTALQARQRVRTPRTAAPGFPLHVAERDQRMGAVPLCCALRGASGLPLARTYRSKKCADGTAFLLALFQSALGAGLTGVHLLLDQGSPHAPHQLGTWMASLARSFTVKMYGLPTHASWLDKEYQRC